MCKYFMIRMCSSWHSALRTFHVLGELKNLSRTDSKIEGWSWWSQDRWQQYFHFIWNQESQSEQEGGKARVSSTSQNSALTHRRTAMRPAYLVIRTDESHQLIKVWSPWHCVVRADWRTDVLSSGVLPAWIMTCSRAFRVTLSAATFTIWSNCSCAQVS